MGNYDKAYEYLTLAYKELDDKACMCSTMGKFYEFKKTLRTYISIYEKNTRY